MNIDHADSTQPRDTTEEWAEYLEKNSPRFPKGCRTEKVSRLREQSEPIANKSTKNLREGETK